MLFIYSLRSTYLTGEEMVPVAKCNEEQYGSHPKMEMLFKEYLAYLRRYSENEGRESMECLYLKDYHFVR